MNKKDFNRLSDCLWEVPRDFRNDMRVPARVYASDRLLEQALRDDSFKQLVNTATLPGIVKYALAMPDVHQGYGFPIGGVVATRTSDGIISPGGVGYDINCGVRVLASDLLYEEAVQHLDTLISALYANCPSGVGKGGSVIDIHKKDFDKVLHEGSRWALDAGYAYEEDVARTEERGQMRAADASQASQRAHERGLDQVGTLGAGNHFLEVDLIEEVFDEEAAAAMGLVRGNIALQIHCGSRGFGHQVCDDYVRSFQKAVQDYNIQLPDRQLVCVPFQSPEGQAYFAAMSAAANFAFANRQVLTYLARRSFEQVFAGIVRHWNLHQVYDVAHNIAKVEAHEVDGRPVEVVVHRKGATRAFGPGQEELPPEYRDIGQPVLVPGSMGTSSWILVGTNAGMEQTFGSTCHGAGRMMSRKKAKSTIRGTELREKLERRGISVRAGSMSGLAEEAPEAYKDVDDVVQVVHGAGIATKVARLTPLAVMKG
jgi:tRNA-splicing ligase RtcB